MSDNKLNSTEEGVLKDYLENELSRQFTRPVTILKMVQQDFERQTSFLTRIVNLQLDNDDRLKIFIKDYSFTRLPKDGLSQRRNREYKVYRDLLSDEHLQVPKYYGAVWNPEQERFWLLLEYVEGTELRYLDFDDWVRAAAWLGTFNGVFIDRKEVLEAAKFLIYHDEGFFLAKAEAAVKAVSEFSPVLVKRLTNVLDRYDQIVNVMLSQPRTLIHGSFRPQNILLARDDSSSWICPVDWELAAYGASLYDLAFIVDGFKPPQLDIMLDAYYGQANRYGIACVDRKEMVYVINCFRLHKIIKSLSESASFGFPVGTVDKLVCMAEAVERSVS